MGGRAKILLMTGISVCLLTGCGRFLDIIISDQQSRRELESAQTASPPSDGIQPVPMRPSESPEDAGQDAPQATEAADQKPEETPDPGPEKLYVTISAAGDVTLGNYYDQEYWGSFRATYEEQEDPAYFFENVYDIFSADDMTIVNLEGPLTRAEERKEEQTYCISGDPEYVKILTAGSVEAVGMGNNHRLDYFQKGSDDTVAALNEAGIPYAYDKYTGIYETPQGIRIGFVSVNGLGQGANVEKYLQEGIASLREEGCDLVLASCHWGTEREYYPEDYQKSLGRKCIDWGADLVIGHHPHVIQGIEEYRGKYIVYSLGNFCFGANRNPEDKDCLIIQQTFTFIEGEKQEETQFKVIPCSVSSIASRNDFKPTPAEGEEAQRILDRLNEYSLELGLQFDRDGYPVR